MDYRRNDAPCLRSGPDFCVNGPVPIDCAHGDSSEGLFERLSLGIGRRRAIGYGGAPEKEA
jgi:hypothetical protein